MTGTRSPARELPAIAAVHVVVPAHDEQERIGACLTSVGYAAEVLAVAAPALRIGMTVVLDRCADATPALVAACGVDALAADAGCVGTARRVGVEAAAAATGDLEPAAVLVVNTDADCVVPPTWLADHVALARTHRLVQGEVVPDPLEMTAAAAATWSRRNPAGRGSLHGANLSFRLDAYRAAGGFPDVPTQEDLLLVRAMKARGVRGVGGTSVVTSARREGRVTTGFASYLRALDLELAAPEMTT